MYKKLLFCLVLCSPGLNAAALNKQDLKAIKELDAYLEKFAAQIKSSDIDDFKKVKELSHRAPTQPTKPQVPTMSHNDLPLPTKAPCCTRCANHCCSFVSKFYWHSQ